MVRRDLDRFNEAILSRQFAKFLAHEPVNQPSKPAGFRWLDALHVNGHSFVLHSGVSAPSSITEMIAVMPLLRESPNSAGRSSRFPVLHGRLPCRDTKETILVL